MNQSNEKHFVGQPIFKQILELLPKNKFDAHALKHQTERYCKAFPLWIQLLTLLSGILSRRDSMGEICDEMMGFKLNSTIWVCTPHPIKAPQQTN